MILDHIENLSIDDEDNFFAKMSLARISQGLFMLYKSISEAEKKVHTKAKETNVSVSVTNLELENLIVDTPWLSSAFQWYAVSVCSYARLVGWLSFHDVKKAKGYADNILPKVSTYRNKVAAHFTMADPWNNDNLADITASVIGNIIYAHGYLRAGAVSLILKDEEGKEITTNHKTSWSLTKLHNKLVPRYWPNGPMPVSNAIPVPAKTTITIAVDWED